MGSDPQGLTPPAIPWFGLSGASLRPGRTSCTLPRAAAPGEGRGKDGRHFGARPQGLTAASAAARWRGTGRRQRRACRLGRRWRGAAQTYRQHAGDARAAAAKIDTIVTTVLSHNYDFS